MAEHLKFERFCWFDRQLRNNRYPTASHFARHFALSTKTVQRTKRGKFFKLGRRMSWMGLEGGCY